MWLRDTAIAEQAMARLEVVVVVKGQSESKFIMLDTTVIGSGLLLPIGKPTRKAYSFDD